MKLEKTCEDFDNKVHVYAMSNMTKQHFGYKRSKFPKLLTLFREVFISADIGMRKPELRFYKHILKELSSITDDPSEILFVDDKYENILAARFLGIDGIIYENDGELTRNLKILFGNSAKRGMEYLTTHAGSFDSATNMGVNIEDNFVELLILEITDDMYGIYC